MKTRFLRILSMTGMLATATAITVNSQILNSAPASASASSTSTPDTTPNSGSTASSTPTPVTASSAPVPGSTTQMSYLAGDAATMILDTADGTLRLVDFAPHPGWVTVRLSQTTAMDLEVRLESGSGQVRFAASLANGVVTTELETPGGPTTTPGNSTPDNSTPDNSTPGNSTPDNSTPGNSTPGGDDNGGDDNGGSGGGSDDSGGDDNSGSGNGSGG